MSTETTTITRPSRLRTAAFPSAETLDAAVAALVRGGHPEDVLGVAVRAGGIFLLTVPAPAGRERAVDEQLLALGADVAGGVHDLPERFGPAPHPGVREEHDMKLPMGREFPLTTWAPAIAGYRVRPPVRDPRDRVWSFDEVELDYPLADALVEADRCLRCPEPRCVLGCPAHNRIPDVIAAVRGGDFQQGVDILRETTDFPGICGRVCDKARQCEGACVLGQEGGDPIAIGLLERFLANWELQAGRRLDRARHRAPATGRRVAIVGSGPSGLAAAQELALRGHAVSIFEALPVLGGALAWGIPTFRLPQVILSAEIDFLRALEVEIHLNTRIGHELTVDQLLAGGFDAVFLGAGATLPLPLGIPGETLKGVYTATEFLALSKLSRLGQEPIWRPPVVGERLAVIGAGNTAMDVAQTAVRLARAELQDLSASQTTMDVAETAMRLGFRDVTVVYRRSEEEMPARREEIESAREEGVRFRFLTAPVRFLGDKDGRVQSMECVEMALGQPDARGRRVPIPKRGSEFIVEADTIVPALGYAVDPTVTRLIPGLAIETGGVLRVDPATGRTGRPGVWAGGDISNGPDTVVRAMVAGRRAAFDIDRVLASRQASALVEAAG